MGRMALVVGHPGHELRVFGLLSLCRPTVHVITDGSGSQGASRLSSTDEILKQAGATAGPLFGVMTDPEMYTAILEKRFSVFRNIAACLADSFITDNIEVVAGDATEGFNPTHDICRIIIDAAVLMARRATGKRIRNFEVRLTGWERKCVEQHDQRCVHFQIGPELLRKKLDAARKYADLKDEVDRSLAHFGAAYFQVECLREVTRSFTPESEDGKPFYESWGERQVAAGRYSSVIRLKEHIQPVRDDIADYVEMGVCS